MYVLFFDVVCITHFFVILKLDFDRLCSDLQTVCLQRMLIYFHDIGRALNQLCVLFYYFFFYEAWVCLSRISEIILLVENKLIGNSVITINNHKHINVLELSLKIIELHFC